MAAVLNTITSALALCVLLADTNGIIFDGSNSSERIANYVFNDNFNTCIDLKFSDIEKHWKTYIYLTVDEGFIRLRPRTKVNIRAFVHWVRERISMSEDQEANPFSTGDMDDLIERYNTHSKWMLDSDGMVKKAMPKTFTDKMKWIDWKVTTINFLKSHNRRNWVPLNYFIRDNVNPIASNNPKLWDDYTDRALLEGKVFTHVAAKVHLYIIRLVLEKTVAEQKCLPHMDNSNGREDFLALKDLYEGVWGNAKAVLAAKNDIQELYYAGEKKPHIWWDEFEIRLTTAFAIVDKDAGCQVQKDESKMHLLNKNICVDLLTNMKTNI